MYARVTSSRLIGRTAELAELEAALADAAAGRPSLVFVAGESGVGKSRLPAELERRAAERDVRVLGGDCVDLGEGPDVAARTKSAPARRRRACSRRCPRCCTTSAVTPRCCSRSRISTGPTPPRARASSSSRGA